MTGKRKNRRRNKQAVSSFLFVLFCVALTAGLVLNRRVFVVHEILVSGNQYISAEKIAEIAGIAIGQSTFSVDKEAVARAFAPQGSVHLLDIGVNLPGTVTLSVRESTPRATTTYAGLTFVIDEYACVIEQLRQLPSYAVPVVTGVEVSSFQIGSPIESAVVGQIDALSSVLKALYGANLQDMTSELNVSNLDNMYLMTRGGLMVKLGDAGDIERKLQWMSGVVAQLAAEGKTRGVLDVSGKNGAVYAPPTPDDAA